MSLNQEFGDRHVPYGISGDLYVGHEAGSTESQRALMAQKVLFDEMLDRQAAGMSTPDEDRYVAQRLQSEVAQGYN
jgi:hypothetical protein